MSAPRTDALAGRRVLVTRSAEDSAAWARELEALGAVPLVLPCIAAEPIDAPALRDALAAADWLVLTSRRGVERTAALIGREALPGHVRVAAVGGATAAAARAALGRVDLVGAGTGAELARALVEREGVGRGTRVVLAVAENARDVVERTLRGAGAECTRIAVYRTVAAPPRAPRVKLSELGADAVLLASPSAVTGFVHQVDVDGPAALYTIGPTTSDAVRAHGLNVAAEARTPSLAALLEALLCKT